MGRFLTAQDFIDQFGEDEARQIAGSGDFNSLEGSLIDQAAIEAEIAFVDELIGGYVLARHRWLADVDVIDQPNLLKGLGGDIVRYRLRDKQDGTGLVSKTVETRYKDALGRLEAIQAGRLDVVRDRDAGADIDPAETPGSSTDVARISGPAPQAARILEGY